MDGRNEKGVVDMPSIPGGLATASHRSRNRGFASSSYWSELGRLSPFEHLLEDFKVWMEKERGFTPATIDRECGLLRQFLLWYGDRRRSISEIGLEDIETFLSQYEIERHVPDVSEEHGHCNKDVSQICRFEGLVFAFDRRHDTRPAHFCSGTSPPRSFLGGRTTPDQKHGDYSFLRYTGQGHRNAACDLRAQANRSDDPHARRHRLGTELHISASR